MNKPTKGYERKVNLHPNPESSSTNDRPLPEDEYGCDVDGYEVWEEERAADSSDDLDHAFQFVWDKMADKLNGLNELNEQNEQEVFAPKGNKVVRAARNLREISGIAVDILANIRACYSEAAKSLEDRAAIKDHNRKYHSTVLPDEVGEVITRSKVAEIQAQQHRREAAKAAATKAAFEVGSFIMDATIRNKEVRAAVSSWMAASAAGVRDRARLRFEIRATDLATELSEAKAKAVKATRAAKG